MLTNERTAMQTLIEALSAFDAACEFIQIRSAKELHTGLTAFI